MPYTEGEVMGGSLSPEYQASPPTSAAAASLVVVWVSQKEKKESNQLTLASQHPSHD